MNRDCALWIGGLEKYMNEEFIANALSLMGEDSVVSVKVIKNKFTGQPASYGFIHFDSDAAALMAMHKLNNKIIPHSQPPVRFQLNHASAKASGQAYGEREFSIWVSDLPEDIDEEGFSRAFASRFDSLRTAKIFREQDGRVYGFIRFSDLNDQRDALIHMNGFHGLGPKPIRVSLAIPKRSLTEVSNYGHMYESYWSDPGAWANYGAFQVSARPVLSNNPSSTQWDIFEDDSGDDEEDKEAKSKRDEERLIDHSIPINVDGMNTEFISRSQEVWDSIEQERWIYNLDNDEGIAPEFRKEK